MSTLETNLVQPATGTTLTLGASGDTIAVGTGATNNLGITVADQWRLSASLTGVTSQYITANLEQIDSSGQGTLGSAMTESSGVFTFPSTGIYLVSYTFLCSGTVTPSSNWDGFVNPEIHVTTNNSAYASVSIGYAGLFDKGGNTGGNGTMTQTLIDVTDTSNVKVKFYVNSLVATTTIRGETDQTATGMTFIRLGDT